MWLRRSIARSVFLSELEFEEGTKEISIEFAALDFNMHPLVNFRGGIIMNPIGAFNQNHDGPKWEFVNRPVAMTQMLPATWSNVGAGMYGRQYIGPWAFGYEVYLTNGFNDAIVNNNLNKTFTSCCEIESRSLRRKQQRQTDAYGESSRALCEAGRDWNFIHGRCVQ
ncbi:MAG: hypothetical protein WDO15_00875 [Bacteroidota bacterium]